MSRVYTASDHKGFALKQALIPYIGSLGYEVDDIGAHEFEVGDDYPDYITPCARAVARDEGSFGVIFGKSGQGEAMCANRIPGIRAAVFYAVSADIIRLAREHNDANILSIGAAFVDETEAKSAVRLFLSTRFSEEGRHMRRLAKF